MEIAVARRLAEAPGALRVWFNERYGESAEVPAAVARIVLAVAMEQRDTVLLISALRRAGQAANVMGPLLTQYGTADDEPSIDFLVSAIGFDQLAEGTLLGLLERAIRRSDVHATLEFVDRLGKNNPSLGRLLNKYQKKGDVASFEVLSAALGHARNPLTNIFAALNRSDLPLDPSIDVELADGLRHLGEISQQQAFRLLRRAVVRSATWVALEVFRHLKETRRMGGMLRRQFDVSDSLAHNFLNIILGEPRTGRESADDARAHYFPPPHYATQHRAVGAIVGVPLSVLAGMVPFLAGIAYFNITNIQFCGVCGRTIARYMSLPKAEVCPECGASLR